MAHDDYPLLPANIPEPPGAAPAPSAPDTPDAINAADAAPSEDDLAEQIHILATTALPARALSSAPLAAPRSPQITTSPPLRVAPADVKPPRSRSRSCLTIGIAAIIILSLLGSSVFSLLWFWNTRSDRVAEVEALAAAGGPALSASRSATGTSGDNVAAAATVLPPTAYDPVNRIVIMNGEGQLESMAPDGSERRVLTEEGRSYQFPAWSPDGRSIAAVGGALGGGGIYVVADEESDGESEEVYYSRTRSPFYLYWSPDGRQISFLTSSRVNGMELTVVPSTGGESRVLAVGSPMYWNWTADGAEMLIHTGDDPEESQIALIDDQGGLQAPRVPAPGLFQAPGISPSGRYWAYSQYQAGNTTWLVTDDREDDVQDGHRHAGAVALSWSPVRDEVAFISGNPDSQFSTWGALRLLDAATGDTRMLSADTVLAFFWSPDGEKILAISLPQAPALGEQFEVRQDNGRQLVSYQAGSPGRESVQNRSHSFRISVIDVRSGEGKDLHEGMLSPMFLAQFLPFFDQYALSHAIWSPDSTTVILPFLEDRQSRIMTLDVRNGLMTELAEGQMGFWSWQ